MSASLLYRFGSVLLLLFAAGHTLGFRRVDPRWEGDGPIEALRSTHFLVQGMRRTYWGFYTGFGLFVTVLLGFAAVTYLSWRYFFVAPVVFSGVVTACLVAAAWLGGPR